MYAYGEHTEKKNESKVGQLENPEIRRRERSRSLNRSSEKKKKTRKISETSSESSSSGSEHSNVDFKEVKRLVADIVNLDPSAVEALKVIGKKLDDGEGVNISGVKNPKTAKKLRHLFYSLKLNKEGSAANWTFRKSEIVDVSFVETVSKVLEKLKYTQQQIVDKPQNIEQNVKKKNENCTKKNDKDFGPKLPEGENLPSTSEEEEEVESGPVAEKKLPGDTKRESWMVEAPDHLKEFFKQPAPQRTAVDSRNEFLEQQEQNFMAHQMEKFKVNEQRSLMEVHQDNLKKGMKQNVSRWNDSSIPWGESRFSIDEGFQDSGQPWRRFNRERDLATTKNVSAAEFQSVMNYTKASKNKFGKPKYLTSR